MSETLDLIEKLRPAAQIVADYDAAVAQAERVCQEMKEEALAAATERLAALGLETGTVTGAVPALILPAQPPAMPEVAESEDEPFPVPDAWCDGPPAPESPIPEPMAAEPDLAPEPAAEVAAEPAADDALPPAAPAPPARYYTAPEVNALIRRFRDTGRLQKDLAEAIGATAPQMSDYLRGVRQPPAITEKIAAVLDLWEKETGDAVPKGLEWFDTPVLAAQAGQKAPFAKDPSGFAIVLGPGGKFRPSPADKRLAPGEVALVRCDWSGSMKEFWYRLPPVVDIKYREQAKVALGQCQRKAGRKADDALEVLK